MASAGPELVTDGGTPGSSPPALPDASRLDQIAATLGAEVAALTGHAYLRALVDRICVACEVDYAFVGRPSRDAADSIETVVLSHRGSAVPNFTYAIDGTPCATVLGRSHCSYPSEVQARFPRDTLLVDMGLHAYVGVPLTSSRGSPLGLLAIMHGKPLADARWLEQIGLAAAARASAELERDDALAELTNSQRRFEAIFHQTFQFIGLLDTAGTLLEANRTALQFAQIEERDVLGRPFWETLWWSHSEGERNKVRDAIARAARGEFVRFETSHPRPDGSLAYVDFSLKPVFDAEGSVVMLIPEGRDISDRKRAEAELKVHEERFRAIAEAMFDAHYEWDASRAHVWRSDSYRRLTGALPTDGDDEYAWWRARVHPDDRAGAESAVRAAVTGRRGRYELRYRFRVQGDTYRWFDDRGFLEFDGSGRVVRTIGALRDVTRDVEAEAAREAMEERIRSAEKIESLGLLAGGIAHDFNNFLTGVLGYAALAEMDLPPDSPARPSVSQIQSVALQAAELTRQMLAYSGRGSFVVKPMLLDELVREMHPLLSKVISRKAELHLDLANAPVRADGAQMRQIVMNLLTNASDALGTAQGRITVRTGVRSLSEDELTTRVAGDSPAPGVYAYLEVEDTGGGMDEATVARMFDPFFTTKVKGRGLGLAAVLGIVRGHKGCLHVTTGVGTGTTFRFAMPALGNALPVAAPRAVSERPAAGAGTLLVVEDEAAIRELTAKALRSGGYRVHTAFDGQDGLDVFDALDGAVDLVLLDLTMPRKSGWEVLAALRAKRPNLPVLLMSGFDRPDGRNGAVQGLAYEFIQKPFTLDELFARLATMLAPPA